MVLLAHIQEQHKLSLGSFSRPKMTEELQGWRMDVGHRRVGRLLGLLQHRERRPGKSVQRNLCLHLAPIAVLERNHRRVLLFKQIEKLIGRWAHGSAAGANAERKRERLRMASYGNRGTSIQRDAERSVDTDIVPADADRGPNNTLPAAIDIKPLEGSAGRLFGCHAAHAPVREFRNFYRGIRALGLGVTHRCQRDENESRSESADIFEHCLLRWS